MHLVPLLLIACFAAVTGDNIGYGLGRFGGRRLVLRFGNHVLIGEQRLQKAEEFFRRYGVVVTARLWAILRQLNGMVAGTVKMDWHRFLTYNILGAVLWVSSWTILFCELGGKGFRFGAGFKTGHFFCLAD